MSFWGAIEAGGTKFACAIGDDAGNILIKSIFKTESHAVTMPKVIAFFEDHQKQYPIKALGCSCFGPIDLDESSNTYGYITSTPKIKWANYNIVGDLKKALNIPIGFDTDVNGAALAEQKWGAAQGVSDFMYITIGTGVGGGIVVNNQLLHGAMHAEIGHILLPKNKLDIDFDGACPFHNNCLEGFASGTAIKQRWGLESAATLPDDHPAWDIEAEYLAAGIMTFILCYSPKKIILGGGVMKVSHLFEKIHDKVKILLNGYIKNKTVDQIQDLIVPVALGDNSGVMGSFVLAQRAYCK